MFNQTTVIVPDKPPMITKQNSSPQIKLNGTQQED